VLQRGRKHRELAVGRAANILLERREERELLDDLKKLVSKGFEHPEVNYYIGVCCWNLANKHDAIVYFESCLNNSKEVGTATKSLKALIRISVEESNFFEAEHHISRISKLGLPLEAFNEWIHFVEGTNDLIKRKNQSALEKITKSLELCGQKVEKERLNSLEVLTFRRTVYPYVAYALYLNNELEKSIEMYARALENNEDRKLEYAKLMAEGIYLHESQKHEEAFSKFEKAYAMQSASEPLFLSCITLVQKYKNSHQEK
jgi:tetratricopeptide (TPR) repeat protein